MNHSPIFLDTAFIQALLNPRDQYHQRANQFLPQINAAQQIWTTEAILVEVGNAFSASDRNAAVQFIQQCYQTPNLNIVSVDRSLLDQALALYASRPDKNWGLTDCISFVVMQAQNITLAATTDRHFIQAGFRALMLEN